MAQIGAGSHRGIVGLLVGHLGPLAPDKPDSVHRHHCHHSFAGRSSPADLVGCWHHMRRIGHRLDRVGSRRVEVGQRSPVDGVGRSLDLEGDIVAGSLVADTAVDSPGRTLAEEGSPAGYRSLVEGIVIVGRSRHYRNRGVQTL